MRRPALARDQRGGISIMGAASFGVGMGMLALVADAGWLHLESRRLQGIADAAALSAAGNLASADAEAAAAITANGGGANIDRQVVTGRYAVNAAIAPDQRFTAGSATPDSARVTLSERTPLLFGLLAMGNDGVLIRRSAVARRADLASFSIGSRLAALDGGLANQLLSGLTGTSISLSVMDHQALLDADIDLFGFAHALQAKLDLEGESYANVLGTAISITDALNALADSLTVQGDATSASAIRRIASGMSSTTSIHLDKLINLGPLGAQDRVSNGQAIRVNAFDLLRGVLELGASGRQVKLDLAASIPGLATTTVWLSVGDHVASSPWLAVTDRGDPVVRTAQTRLYVEAKLGTSGLLALLGAVQVRVPLYVELAEAEAKLSAIACANGRRRVDLLVRPAVGHASIADIDTTKLNDHRTALTEGQASLVTLPLLSIKGRARVDLTGPSWQPLSFSGEEIAAKTVKKVSSNSLVGGVAGSLISGISLTVNFLGIGVSTGAITSAVGTLLAPAAAPLDALIGKITGLLGIHLGQADVRVNGVRCGQAALVA